MDKEKKQWQINKAKYDKEYHKKNYKQFKVELPIAEIDEINKILEEHNMTKVELVRNAIEQLKKTK